MQLGLGAHWDGTLGGRRILRAARYRKSGSEQDKGQTKLSCINLTKQQSWQRTQEPPQDKHRAKAVVTLPVYFPS